MIEETLLSSSLGRSGLYDLYRGVVRYIEGDITFVVCGGQISINKPEDADFKHIALLPFGIKERLFSGVKMIARLTRTGIFHILKLGTGDLMAFSGRDIFRYSHAGGWSSCGKIVGSRPLAVALGHTGDIFYGEYRNNAERSPVSVWRSIDNGVIWNPAWTFNNIRHIHGVFYDPYTKSIWVTTGDKDVECGIWVTNDNFIHLDLVVGGTQQFRVIQLLFTKQFIYFGSDALIEENYIYRMERKTGKIDALQKVLGTVFCGCKVGDNLFFSTAVEPSTYSKNNYACLWGSPDGDRWKCITKFYKDIWPMKLFQYGQIIFPAGDNHTGKLWFTPWATEYDQTVQCIDMQKIDWN